MEKTKKEDFIELEFTGYHNGKVFDSNVPEDLKQLSKEAKPQKLTLIIGEKMVVPGLDKALEDKEVGKEYNVHIAFKDGFGPRRTDLVKTIPLHVFTNQKIMPRPGEALLLDNMLAKIITVSGARVITDFNNPLAGKDLDYKFKILKIIAETKEKITAFFQAYFNFVPEFEINGDKVIVRDSRDLGEILNIFNERFKKATGKSLGFEQKKEEKPEIKPEA